MSTNVGGMLSKHGRLIGFLMQHGPTTRSGLMELLVATQPTITRWIAELMSAGVVHEVGFIPERTGPGRPSVLLDIDASSIHVGCLHVRATQVEIGVVNGKGHVTAYCDFAVVSEQEHISGAVIHRAADKLNDLLAQAGIKPECLLGIGVAASGLVNPSLGIEERVSFVGDRMVGNYIPIQQQLAGRFPVTVVVETNAYAMAMAERWFGSRESNFLLVYVDDGVGAAIVTGGQLHKGRGAAGEIEHVQVPGATELCFCGRNGCLGTQVNTPIVLEQARTLGYANIAELLRAASASEKVRAAIQHFAQAIGHACAPMVDLIDPETVVLAGPLFSSQDLVDHVRQTLLTHSFIGRLHGIRVYRSNLSGQIGLIGAASLVYARAMCSVA